MKNNEPENTPDQLSVWLHPAECVQIALLAKALCFMADDKKLPDHIDPKKVKEKSFNLLLRVGAEKAELEELTIQDFEKLFIITFAPVLEDVIAGKFNSYMRDRLEQCGVDPSEFGLDEKPKRFDKN